METIPIKLKINDHYETLCLIKLYQEWNTNQLKSYNFSKSQMTRIKSLFEQHSSSLSTSVLSTQLPTQLPTVQTTQPSPDPMRSETEITHIVDPQFSLDVYTDSDFDQYNPTFSTKFYYQQLLNALNVIHQKP
jgi:hypothetical protein